MRRYFSLLMALLLAGISAAAAQDDSSGLSTLGLLSSPPPASGANPAHVDIAAFLSNASAGQSSSVMVTPQPTGLGASASRYQLLEPTDLGECSETARPPEVSELWLEPQPDGSLAVDYGSGVQTVDPSDTPDVYMADVEAADGATYLLMVTMPTDGSGGSLTRSVVAGDGSTCQEMRLFLGAEAAAELIVPTPQLIWGGHVPLIAGVHRVRWFDLAGSHCTAELAALLPEFAQVTLVADDSDFIMTTDTGLTYLLEQEIAGFVQMDVSADGVNNMVSAVNYQGQMTGSVTNLLGGSLCVRPFELVPVSR